MNMAQPLPITNSHPSPLQLLHLPFFATYLLSELLRQSTRTIQYESVDIPFRTYEPQITQYQTLELGSLKTSKDAALHRVVSSRRKESNRASRQNLKLQPSTSERSFLLPRSQCRFTHDIRPRLPRPCFAGSRLPRIAFSQNTRSN